MHHNRHYPPGQTGRAELTLLDPFLDGVPTFSGLTTASNQLDCAENQCRIVHLHPIQRQHPLTSGFIGQRFGREGLTPLRLGGHLKNDFGVHANGLTILQQEMKKIAPTHSISGFNGRRLRSKLEATGLTS